MVAKKNNDDDRQVEVALSDWVNKDVHMGTPTVVLLPAANYMFRVKKGEHKITVPRKGVYEKIDPSAYSKTDGEFNLLDEKNQVMYLPAISKVLFATKKYPDLEPNQLFAPIALVFHKEEVDIIGHVVEMLDPSSVKSSASG